MKLSPEVATIVGFLIATFALLLGRNPVLWFLLGYLYPIVAVLMLPLRHKAKPEPSPKWFVNLIERFLIHRWAMKLEPSDFKSPPLKGERHEL